MSTLKEKAISGVVWSTIDKFAVRGASFIIGIVIARILMPSDYGIIGMIMVFLSLSNIFIDSGMSQALVQKKDRSLLDMSTAFYFNIAVALVCYCILFFTAPSIARFYEMPMLVPILRVLGINVVLNSLSTVQIANLLIKIDFKRLAIVHVVAVVASGTVGIWMAYSGFGVWALVGQMMTNQGLSMLLLWFIGKWRPAVEFSKASLKRLWNFGSKLLIAGTVATVTREIYSMTIGKFYRASELGYYQRAVQTTDLVSTTVYEIINSVTFPILSSVQDDKERMVSIYSRMLSMTAFFIFPIMTFLAVVAHPLVSVLLTDKWLPAAILIQWLCFARMFTPISALNMNILNATGRSDLFMKIDLSKLPLTILTMAITIPIGVKAIVIGNFVNTFICYFINAYLPGKLYGFGVKAQFKIFYKIALLTTLMALASFCIMLVTNNNIIKLLLATAAAIITYFSLAQFLQIPEFAEMKNIVRTYALGKLKR